MKTLTKLFAAVFLATTLVSAADARPHRMSSDYRSEGYSVKHKKRHYDSDFNTRKNYARMHGDTSRPGKWCGWWMRTQLGGGPEYNLARNWARRGSPSGPRVGAVVVWPHHVGMITGRASNGQWIVKSGNDGGRVRERARSVSGAIAFRAL